TSNRRQIGIKNGFNSDAAPFTRLTRDRLICCREREGSASGGRKVDPVDDAVDDDGEAPAERSKWTQLLAGVEVLPRADVYDRGGIGDAIIGVDPFARDEAKCFSSDGSRACRPCPIGRFHAWRPFRTRGRSAGFARARAAAGRGRLLRRG